MGRPKIELDTEEIIKLASYGCTNREIASFFDVSERTLKRSFADFLTKGRDSGKRKLRKVQWEVAMKGNVSMLIWLGKQVLGQSEQPSLVEDEEVEGFDIEVISSVPTSE